MVKKDNLILYGAIAFIVLGIIYLVYGTLSIIDVTGNLINSIFGR